MSTRKINPKEFEDLAVIAVRKAQFYEKVESKFVEKIPESSRDEAKTRLSKVISQLDNWLFISSREKERGFINPCLSIDQLGLNIQKIQRAIVRDLEEMSTTTPT